MKIQLSILKKKITLNYPKSAAMGIFPWDSKCVEIAAVNELSVFEPLKVYCMMDSLSLKQKLVDSDLYPVRNKKIHFDVVRVSS